MNCFKPKLTLICPIIMLCWVLTPATNECLAGEKPAFDTVDIGLQVITNTNRNDFHRQWASSPGLEGYLLTPFYLGDFHLGVRGVSFESRPADLMDYLSVFVYAGWGLSWALPYNLKGFTGFSIGSDQMWFEREDRPGSKRESEFGLAINTRLSAPLPGRWAVTAGGSYTEIFTHKRIRLVFLSVGVSRTLDLPGWLREFLK
jgi:hypothetical protein